MTKIESIVNKAKSLINKLDFDGCIEALNKPELEPFMNLIMDRMIELDSERFIKFSEEY